MFSAFLIVLGVAAVLSFCLVYNHICYTEGLLRNFWYAIPFFITVLTVCLGLNWGRLSMDKQIKLEPVQVIELDDKFILTYRNKQVLESTDPGKLQQALKQKFVWEQYFSSKLVEETTFTLDKAK